MDDVAIAEPSVFARHESNVQAYARAFPAVFDRAEGSLVYDRDGRAYIDFLAGAGSLNYGHNNPYLRDRLLDYIARGGIAHSLDLHTAAKEGFLHTLADVILRPRGLDYVVQFTGPTGTNAVEAALKLARRVTGRSAILAFTNGFHGVSAGALAATANTHHRGAAGVPLAGVCRMPYDGYLGAGVDTLAYLEKTLADPSSGIDPPAAAIVETIQGEGGLNVAGVQWLRRLERLCRDRGILLIVDDIQAGCGRGGTFFSFEPAGIVPDIVVLSKSLSGFGLPMAIAMFRRQHDAWQPGEHNGTFRGNNHAFVTATEALRRYWATAAFAQAVQAASDRLAAGLDRIAAAARCVHKGRGMMRGLACPSPAFARAVSRAAFARGLIVETCGPHDEVVKCLPPLTTAEDCLDEALDILGDSVREAADRSS